LNTHISKGSAATDLRPGGRFNASFFRTLLLNINRIIKNSLQMQKLW